MQRISKIIAISLAFGSLQLTAGALAQDEDADHEKHHPQQPATDDRQPSEIFEELHTRLKRLEVALMRDHQEARDPDAHSDHVDSDPSHSSMQKGMEMKDKGMRMGMGKIMGHSKMSMGGMGDKEMEMGKMMGMMQMMDGMKMGDMMSMKGMDMGKMMKMKGMRMMGMMKNSSTMAQTALPGFPGASHIYHIGSTEFFLDHGDHIELSDSQQASLRKAREKAQLTVADFDRKIEQAEQDLWVLSSSDQPDIDKISAKAKEIGNLNAESRIAYIRAVGDAAKLLTEDQRKTLVGVTEGAESDGSEHVHAEEPK